MTCPNHNGPLCTTCRLGGLIRCPILGVPLPLVEHEKPKVFYRGYLTSGPDGSLRWTKLTDPTDWSPM